jgi:transposase
MARFKSTKAGRKKKKHINRANVVIRRTPAETMQAAVTAVLGPQGMSIRAAAKNFDIPYCTLHSYVAKRRASGTDEIRYNANYSVRMVFSKDQEQQLNICLKRRSIIMASRANVLDRLRMTSPR